MAVTLNHRQAEWLRALAASRCALSASELADPILAVHQLVRDKLIMRMTATDGFPICRITPAGINALRQFDDEYTRNIKDIAEERA